MQDQNRASGHLSFLLEGRAEDKSERVVASSESVNDYKSTHELVYELQNRSKKIAEEIALALLEATGYKFSVQISFHPGSVVIQGIVSTLATTEIFQAAANFGGTLALAQTIASVVSAVVGQHLPSWMSKPIIRASATGSPAPPVALIQPTSLQHGQERELRAIKWAVMGLLICAALATGKYLFGTT